MKGAIVTDAPEAHVGNTPTIRVGGTASRYGSGGYDPVRPVQRVHQGSRSRARREHDSRAGAIAKGANRKFNGAWGSHGARTRLERVKAIEPSS